MAKKAVVLAAGEGTRLKPITDAVPKEMIRVGEKPTIHHVIDVLKAGGVEEVLVVVGREKEAIIDYLGSGKDFGLDIYFRVQEEPKGTADAVSLAKDFVDNDFVVVYGDNYIKPYNKMKKIRGFHDRMDGDGTMVLHPVDDPTRFGIVDLDENNRIDKMVEKPSVDEAEPFKRDGGWLSIAGLMVLSPKIFNYIKEIEPGKNNELWLTDAIEKMRKHRNKIFGYIFKGNRYDIGTFKSLKKADKLENKSN